MVCEARRRQPTNHALVSAFPEQIPARGVGGSDLGANHAGSRPRDRCATDGGKVSCTAACHDVEGSIPASAFFADPAAGLPPRVMSKTRTQA